MTVVIPAWDGYAGSGLLDAVASVQRQRCPHQLMVVDNASRTPLPSLPGAAVLTLGARVSTGAARNAALQSIATPYVLFLDAGTRRRRLHCWRTVRSDRHRQPGVGIDHDHLGFAELSTDNQTDRSSDDA